MFLSLPWVPPQSTLSLHLSSFCPIQVPLDNHIPSRAGPGSWVPAEAKDLEENEVIPKRISPFEGDEDVSNKVSMSSATQSGNIFERTEVLAGKVLTRYFEGGEDWEAVLQTGMPRAHWASWYPFLLATGCPGASRTTP